TINGFPGGVPSCELDFPIGHKGPISDSKSFQDTNEFPIKFTVTPEEEEPGIYRIKINGGFIKGYLIRETNLRDGGSWSSAEGFDQWTTVREDCVSHNIGFSQDRNQEDGTNIEFLFKSKN
ncbi:Uncharacterized protein FKW44_019291, partial [Caligus rogercresseyi]